MDGVEFVQLTEGSRNVFGHIGAVMLGRAKSSAYEIATERGKQATGNVEAA